MALPASSSMFTYDDFLLFPDDGRRHEIIDGEHFVSPSPKTKHQVVSRNLVFVIQSYLESNPIGYLYPAPFDIIFSDTNIVEPDIIYISKDRASIITDSNIRGVPDLVIEILSESSRKTDEIIKRKLYERFGVPEYWVADPVIETVKIFRQSSSGYERVAELASERDESLTSPFFPGLTIDLTKIFTER